MSIIYIYIFPLNIPVEIPNVLVKNPHSSNQPSSHDVPSEIPMVHQDFHDIPHLLPMIGIYELYLHYDIPPCLHSSEIFQYYIQHYISTMFPLLYSICPIFHYVPLINIFHHSIMLVNCSPSSPLFRRLLPKNAVDHRDATRIPTRRPWSYPQRKLVGFC